MLKWFPLLLIALVFYNLLIFGGDLFVPAGQSAAEWLASGITIKMFSGDAWYFTLGDLVVLITLGLLFIEVVKATRTTAVEVLNHGLSALVFVVALIEFVTMHGFATTTFFFIVIMAFFDVVAGFTISIVAAKRDLGATGGLIGTN
jgi:hypothetical protein